MSKTLVLKSLSLLQEENKDKSQKDNVKKNKRKKNFDVSHGTTLYAPVDKTAKNLEILKQLKQLRPKPSVAQKVIQIYVKQKNPEEDSTENKPQRSILFDDNDDDDEEEVGKRKKKRRRREVEDEF